MKYLLIVIATSITTFGIIAFVFFNHQPNVEIGKRIEFQTMNKEFVFSAMPSKGRGYESLERGFALFKEANPEHNDLILYRTTSMNLLRIDDWIKYRVQPEWGYPYLYFWY